MGILEYLSIITFGYLNIWTLEYWNIWNIWNIQLHITAHELNFLFYFPLSQKPGGTPVISI